MSAFRLAAAMALMVPGVTMAQEAAVQSDPATVRVEDALGCALDVPTYTGFAMWLGGPDDGARALGWKKLRSRGLTFTEYRLPSPVELHGYRTDRIALSGSGIQAMLDNADVDALAQALETDDAFPATPGFLGQRVISETSEDSAEGGLRTHMKVSIELGTASTHPGITFVGCGYTLDFETLGDASVAGEAVEAR